VELLYKEIPVPEDVPVDWLNLFLDCMCISIPMLYGIQRLNRCFENVMILLFLPEVLVTNID
jgi:hypothetical protein